VIPIYYYFAYNIAFSCPTLLLQKLRHHTAQNQTILYIAHKQHFVVRTEYLVLTWDGVELTIAGRAVSPVAMQPEV